MNSKEMKSNDQTSFAEDSHARTSALLETARVLPENDRDYGLNISESFAQFDRDSYSWKTSQLCLDGDLEEFSETFPRAGMMRNGNVFRRVPLALSTDAIGYLSSPTVTKQNICEPTNPSDRIRILASGWFLKTTKNGTEGSMNWSAWVLQNAVVPTPKLSEWWMGFPIGWTGLEASATP